MSQEPIILPHNGLFLDLTHCLPATARSTNADGFVSFVDKMARPNDGYGGALTQLEKVLQSKPDNVRQFIELISQRDVDNSTQIFESEKDRDSFKREGYVRDGELRTAGEIRKGLKNARDYLKIVTRPQWIENRIKRYREFLERIVNIAKLGSNFIAESRNRRLPHPELVTT